MHGCGWRDCGARAKIAIPADARHHVALPMRRHRQAKIVATVGPASRDPATLRALQQAAALGAQLGLAVHAGHGLSVANVGPVAAIPEIEELNIGHAIIGRAIFVGLREAVREIRAAMDDAREADRF